MKINFFNKENIIIYLNRFFSDKIDVEDTATLEEYFKQLFLKLHKYYHIKLSGYYNVVIYHDPYYGMVIVVHKEDIEYYHYNDTEIDMRIIINQNKNFLYELKDIFDIEKSILNLGVLYRHLNHNYLHLTNEISFIELGKLLEKSNLIYENTDDIIQNGKRITI